MEIDVRHTGIRATIMMKDVGEMMTGMLPRTGEETNQKTKTKTKPVR